MTPYDGSKAKREMQLEAPQLPSPLQGGIALTFGLASAPAAALRSSSSSLAELPLLAVPGLRFSLYGTAMCGRDISKSRASRAPGEIGRSMTRCGTRIGERPSLSLQAKPDYTMD